MLPSLPNTASLMTASSQHKSHTDPGAQHVWLNNREHTKAQVHARGVCMHSHNCKNIPEEELSIVTNACHSQLPSLQLPIGSKNPILPSFPPQVSTPITPGQATQTEHYSLHNAHLSGASTPVRSRRSPSYVQPSPCQSFGEELQWQRGHVCHGSTTLDPRTSLSTPASEMWSENLNPYTMEEHCFPHNELEDSEEYNQPLNLLSDDNNHDDAISMGHHSGNFPYTVYPAHSSCSLPALLHSRYHSQGHFKYGQRQCRMSTRYHNKQG